MLSTRSSGSALAIVLLVVAVDTAAAQGLFGFFGRRAPPQTDGRAPAYADPGRGSFEGQGPGYRYRYRHSYSNGGSSSGYCVRLCDGRYFPVQRSGDANPETLCSAFCPASKTKVFFGSSIDGARARDGKRYDDLGNAYKYRERIVPDCTCNGKDSFGLVTLDAATDPTLRPGDIIATKDGLMAYKTSRSRRGTETANFTPVERSDLPRSRRGRERSLEED